MDEVAIYNHELTSSEINSIYSSGVKVNLNDNITKYYYDEANELTKEETKASDGLLAYYSFDNSNINDGSGNGNNGNTHGSPIFVAGKTGKALEFDGIDDWAELTDFNIPETYSISMWVNPYTTNDGQSFIGKHTDSGDNILIFGYWSGGYHVRLRNDVNIQGTKATGYQHLVVLVKKLSSTQSLVKVYKNGLLLWEKKLNDVIGNSKGKPWVLGQDWDGTTLTDFFKGAIDEVAIYDHYLTRSEISSVYTNGVKVSPRKATTYAYDDGGNLTSKKEYDYTVGDLTTPSKTITYGYADLNWRDKLSSYNGKPITYDEIGNVTAYDNWEFTWEGGRRLTSLSKPNIPNTNSTSVLFKYNNDGIRTEKDINGAITKYHLDV